MYISLLAANSNQSNQINPSQFSEKERVDSLCDFLKQNGILPNGLVCEKFKEGRQKFAPFTGGGDLLLRSELKLISCSISSGNPHCHDDGSISPRYEHEYRFASVEAKISTTQNDVDILLRLQANMLLAIVSQLERMVSKKTVTVKDLTKLRNVTSYGIAVCATDRTNLLLRMTCDFQRNTVDCERLFGFHSFVQAPTKFDSVLEFVVRRLMAKPTLDSETLPDLTDSETHTPQLDSS